MGDLSFMAFLKLFFICFYSLVTLVSTFYSVRTSGVFSLLSDGSFDIFLAIRKGIFFAGISISGCGGGLSSSTVGKTGKVTDGWRTCSYSSTRLIVSSGLTSGSLTSSTGASTS